MNRLWYHPYTFITTTQHTNFVLIHRRHCVVVLERDTFIQAWFKLVPGTGSTQETSPCLTERLLMGRNESNQTNKNNYFSVQDYDNSLICSSDTCLFRPQWRHNPYKYFDFCGG